MPRPPVNKHVFKLLESKAKYKLPFSSTTQVDFLHGCLLAPLQKPRWLTFQPRQRAEGADHEFHAPF